MYAMDLTAKIGQKFVDISVFCPCTVFFYLYVFMSNEAQPQIHFALYCKLPAIAIATLSWSFKVSPSKKSTRRVDRLEEAVRTVQDSY